MKRLFPRLLIMSAIATLLGLALLNFVAWAWEYAKYGTTTEDGRPKGLYVISEDGRPMLKPGARLNGLLYEISINSLGFRGPEIALEKPPDTLRIWCAGGSTTFDIFASSDEATWPQQLQRILGERLPNRTVEVVNAGIPGEMMAGNLEDFKRLAPRMRPDVLVLYQGPNDLRKITDGKFGAPNLTPLKVPAIMRLIHRVIAFQPTGFLLPPVPKDWEARELDAGDMEPILTEMQLFVDAARALGTSVMLVSHAHAAAEKATGREALHALGHVTFIFQMKPEKLIQGFALMNRLFEKMARDQGLMWADVRAAVPTGSDYWGDGLHFEDPGSRLAAEVIADAIADGK